jgi:hypothetical protein
VIVSEKGDVLITGHDEVGERLTPIRVSTLRAKPTPEPWLKRDFGIALGVCWDFDRTVEPCIRIQMFRWFASVTAPDPVVSTKYVGVSLNLPLRLWILKNTSVGATATWNYKDLALTPDIALLASIRL